MEYYFRLDGQAPSLAILEFEALFGIKPQKEDKQNTYTAELHLSKDRVRGLCERSAMVKKAWTATLDIWRSYSPQYPGREPKDKPAFHPSMLKPKWARLLINLARLNPGNKLLDPFCGTGSILIEAYFLDIKSVGIDLDARAVDKANTNLDHYGIFSKLDVGDATHLDKMFKPESFEGIVTDLPYGRSSTLGGKEISKLYYNFLKAALPILKKGHYLVMMRASTVKHKVPSGLKKVGHGDLYAHRGLTRRAIVFQKK